jgi:hypothetical protein
MGLSFERRIDDRLDTAQMDARWCLGYDHDRDIRLALGGLPCRHRIVVFFCLLLYA